MADLRGMLAELGLHDVRTLLQSGNVVFRTNDQGGRALEERIEGGLSKKFGLTTEVFVRTAKEWQAMIEENPFPTEAEKDPGHLLVTALRAPPPAASWEALLAAIRGRERIQGNGRHAYIVYPDGVGRSNLTATLIEGKLGTRATSRNWNTVRKIDRLAGE